MLIKHRAFTTHADVTTKSNINFLFLMSYKDFWVKSKLKTHCFNYWIYHFQFLLFATTFLLLIFAHVEKMKSDFRVIKFICLIVKLNSKKSFSCSRRLNNCLLWEQWTNCFLMYKIDFFFISWAPKVAFSLLIFSRGSSG